jgi:hypothetical protein
LHAGEAGGKRKKGRSLFFFVDGNQIPYSITKIPPSVHFGVFVYVVQFVHIYYLFMFNLYLCYYYFCVDY